jgi:pyruvate dehydrogenase E2 component (dihydrolipoamide acetyltransferase)
MPPSPVNEAGEQRLNELVMPKLGLTMTEGVLADWKVRPGDRVRAGQVMFVVETDKIANEIDAPSDGEIVEILVESGVTVPVGAPLARWTGAGLALSDDGVGAAALPQQQSRPMHGAADNASAGRVKATPLARRMARTNQLDISSVAGSGPGGRIKAADVEQALSAAAPRPKVIAAPRPAAGPERITPSAKHLAMARRVMAATREIPHFYVTRAAEISALAALRGEMNATSGPKITVTHFLIKAVGRALIAIPKANRIWDNETLVGLPDSDVGMVVNSDDGLFIPVLRNVGDKALDRIALEADGLAGRARLGQLARDDMEGAAISISNLGMAGAASLAPIINPPHSAMLGVGAVSEIFRPDQNGAPVLRREVTLTLACDHRVHDGMMAARFLNSIVQGLEAPHSLLLTTTSQERG